MLLHQAPAEARLWPLVFGRIAATLVVLTAAGFTGNFSLPQGVSMRLALAAALFDVGANITMLLALQGSLQLLAGVLISLYPVATVLLAIAVLRERMTRWQVVGMVLAVVSVALIAMR